MTDYRAKNKRLTVRELRDMLNSLPSALDDMFVCLAGGEYTATGFSWPHNDIYGLDIWGS